MIGRTHIQGFFLPQNLSGLQVFLINGMILSLVIEGPPLKPSGRYDIILLADYKICNFGFRYLLSDILEWNVVFLDEGEAFSVSLPQKIVLI